MKYSLALSVFVVSLIGTFGRPFFTDHEIELFKSKYKSCIEESNVNASYAVAIIANAVIENDGNLKEFLFCVNKQNGLQDADGNFLKDALRRIMEDPSLPRKYVEDLVNKCPEACKVNCTPQEKAFQYILCFRRTFLRSGTQKHS